MLLEVDQLKQLDLVALRGEDQLVLLAVEAHLEGDLIKDQIQGFFHLGHEFCAAGVVFVVVHHLAQFCFHLGKGFPPVLCPLSEALRELGQGNKTLTGINELLGIFITRKFLQRLAKIGQCPALLIQIVIGISHTEVPTVVFCKVVCMGFQQGKRLLIQFPILWNSQVVVGAGQFTVHLRGMLLGRDSLQRVNDLLVLPLFMPLLALL